MEKERVTMVPGGQIESCPSGGGVVLCNILLTPRDEHYLMVTAMDEEWDTALIPTAGNLSAA
ncbi:MAG: hypothetical protein R2874_16870 [Desulfobacterales bacterium]